MSKVAVFGAGSWGTAFSVVLADAGNDVTLWARREELCAIINQKRENTDYLPGIDLPETVQATHDAEKAVDAAEAVFFVLPSQTFRPNLEQWTEIRPQACPGFCWFFRARSASCASSTDSSGLLMVNVP